LVEQIDGVEVEVFRNDSFTIDSLENFDKIILSPGPGLPSEAGVLNELIRKAAGQKSIFGVCLGMQAIAEVFGGNLFNLERVQHGVANTTTVVDAGELLFKGLPSQFKTGRYHSWMVSRDRLPSCLQVTAIDEQKNIMAIRHNEFDVCGVQFHPESVLTEFGKKMLENWVGSG